MIGFRSKAIATLVLCLVASNSLSEGIETIGSVLSDTGVPVAGFPVVIANKSQPNENFVSITDSAGQISIGVVPSGTYVATPANDLAASMEFEVETKEPRCFAFGTICGEASFTASEAGQFEVPSNWSISPNFVLEDAQNAILR